MKRLLGLVALLGLLALPACSSNAGSYELVAVFEKGVSLYPGSQVKVLGLPAGTISAVEVDGTVVRVRLSIDADIPVPEGVLATIVPASLIGERYVQLSPAWTAGTPKVEPGSVIPLDRTNVPVEPDEALAALKAFLDALDPAATGRLVRNLGDDLDGKGAQINDALREVADLTTTLAAKRDELAALVDSFDDFTATLVTREARIAEALRDFANLTDLLASERAALERLLGGLGALSTEGLVLVTEHRAALDRDLKVLARTLRLVDANLDGVGALLDAAPLLIGGPDYTGRDSGLIRAVDPEYHRIDLRNNASPLISSLLNPIGLPVQPICIPADTTCPSQAGVPRPGSSAGPAAEPTPPTQLPATVTDRERPGRGVTMAPEPSGARSLGLLGRLRSLGRILAEVVS